MLAGYAVHVENSRGRRFPEPSHAYRNDFQRDRDRVIHSRAFRRLEAKTQVFTRRYSDHFRNRLTHTIEVAQISRTIAGALGLKGDLNEARAALALSIRLEPEIKSLAQWRSSRRYLNNPQYEALLEKTFNIGLRRIGFPDE